MAFKIYKKNNYIIIEDTIVGKQYQGLAKNVFVYKDILTETTYDFEGLTYNGLKGISLSDIIDENDTAFVDEQSFIDFYTTNTGNFNLGGGSPQLTANELLGIQNSNQLSATNPVATQQDIEDLTFDLATFSKNKPRNIVDLSKLSDGYLSASGTLTGSGTTAKTTDFLPLTNGDTVNSLINSTGVWGSCLYDQNKVFLQKINITPSTVINNVNAKFIRGVFYPIANFTSDFSKQIVINEPLPDELIPFESEVEINNPKDEIAVKESIFKNAQFNLYKLANFKKASSGVSNTTGLEIVASGGGVSWYLPVVANKIYSTNALLSNYGAFYSDNKNFVAGITTAKINGNSFYFTNSNIKFARLFFLDTATNPYICERSFLPADLSISPIKKILADINYQETIVDLIKKSEILYGKKVNFLGDSITAYADSYAKVLREEKNMYVRNYGLNGSRITNVAGDPVGSSMSYRYSTMDDDADIIAVFGGINDMNNLITLGSFSDTTDATFYGALKIMMKGISIKYLGKKIGFITPLNYGNLTHNPYHNAINEVCNYYSIPVLNLKNDGLINTVIPEISTAFFSDGLHPNNNGHIILARKIYEFLKTL